MNKVAVIGIAVCWGALVLTWLAGAIYYEQQAPAERKRSLFGTAVWPGLIVTIAVTYAVPRADWNSLALHPAWVRILGLAILVAATALAIWARLALGAMWSAVPAVKQEHKLRTSGPYAVTRHPIYTGMLGMLLGGGLLAGGVRWLVPFPVGLVFVEIKLHIEERFMAAEFPDDYPLYRQRVPQLIPGLRLIRRVRAHQAPPQPERSANQ
jgi:protein-S-isoprenylcysteine O-methyltransferase Ste14